MGVTIIAASYAVLFSLASYLMIDADALLLVNGVCSGVELWLRLIEREARVKTCDGCVSI